jgi:uncharacterized protein YegL
MSGTPITELNSALLTYREDLLGDTLAAKRVEVAIVTFGGQVQTVCDFATAENFVPPTLSATGDTPMGQAIVQALDMLQARKTLYRDSGIQFYRPWIFLITDGAPTDSWQAAAERVKQAESAKAVALFAVAVEGANLDVLRRISVREPVKLGGLRFRELFRWLSNSQQHVSRSKPGEDVALPPPTGWAAV